MNYRSVANLNNHVRRWVAKLPRDFDLIVGIPRSGLLVANLVALHLNLPLSDVEGFLVGRVIKSGRRKDTLNGLKKFKVLIVDDSLNSGGQMVKIRRMVEEANIPHEVYYSAVYVVPGQEKYLDFYYEKLAHPRLFEWNLVRHPILLTSCFDIDGVFCADPTDDSDDDGPKYEAFLNDAAPLFIPSVPIGWLVTCRLEKYRQHTETWLEKYGIQYRELIMMPYSSRRERLDAGDHSVFKASVYQQTEADLFIESSLNQAVDIAFLSQKNVLCMETKEMVKPMAWSSDESCLSTAAYPSILDKNREKLDRFQGQMISEGDWTMALQKTVTEILDIIPKKMTFVLVDNDQLGVHQIFAGRRVLPFIENKGYYSGPPVDGSHAITEFERMLVEGASFLVIAWPAFWWLEEYRAWKTYLDERFSVVLDNERVMIYDLGGQ